MSGHEHEIRQDVRAVKHVGEPEVGADQHQDAAVADRQLAPDPQVVDFLVLRIERSLAAAAAVFDILDRTALAEGRPITRPLAAAALGGREEDDA